MYIYINNSLYSHIGIKNLFTSYIDSFMSNEMPNLNDFCNFYVVKYVVVGFCGVGKTSMLECYVNNVNAYYEHKITIGIEYYQKKIMHQNKILHIHMWDTAGQERYNSVVRQYYRDPHGAFLCFSITNRSSFKRLENYLYELKAVNENNVHIILVGTFSDMEKSRTVKKKDIMKFAEKHGLQYIEVSSKIRKNIDKCFNTMHNVVCKRIDNKDESIPLQSYLPYDSIKSLSTVLQEINFFKKLLLIINQIF